MTDERILVVPDIHAGYRQSRVDDLARLLPAWLAAGPPPRLVLIGDVLDLWRARPADALAAARGLFRVVADFLGRGGAVDYLIGNHDYHLLLDLARGREMVNQMPAGIRFHHRYLPLTHRGKKILVTHGDDYDFLYIPLELLPFGLAPAQVYDFYEAAFHLDKAEIAGWDKDQLRGFLMAWLKQQFERPTHRGCLAAPVALLADFRRLFARDRAFFTPGRNLSQQITSTVTHAPSGLALFTLRDYLDAFKTVSDLGAVLQHTPTAQGWGGILNYDPYADTASTDAFRAYDHLVVGHFHDPRRPTGLPVTDSGSWVTDPHGQLQSGTYVEITGGQIRLHFTDKSSVLAADL